MGAPIAQKIRKRKKCRLRINGIKPPSTTAADFLFHLKNKTKKMIFLLVVTCVGDSYCYCHRHGIFQNIPQIFNINIISQSNNDNSQQGPPHQICLRASSSSVTALRAKTAFACHKALFEFNTMPFVGVDRSTL
jgi:response regulator RpfG family c-di-GMP phosphodiesterase